MDRAAMSLRLWTQNDPVFSNLSMRYNWRMWCINALNVVTLLLKIATVFVQFYSIEAGV